jgi:hypothetical protein
MADERKEGLSEGQTMLMWIVGLVAVLLLFAAYKPELLRLWKNAAVWHAHTLSKVDGNAAGRAFYSAIGTDGEYLEKLSKGLERVDHRNLTKAQVWAVSDLIGKTLRWFLAPILLLLAWDMLRYPKRYRRNFPNGVALFRYVQKNFGQHLARADNALNADLYKGDHAVARAPWQWCIENKCVKADEQLDEPKAIEALRKQLGAPFSSWDALLKGKNGWIAKEILGHLKSNSDREGVTTFAIRGHRYESTVLIALLLATRRFGVVSCMVFSGLRKTDRALWYAIESAGRRVAFVEGAGIMAQYEYEMALINIGKGKHTPQEGRVEAALTGLKESLELEVKETRTDAPSDASVWASYDPTKT